MRYIKVTGQVTQQDKMAFVINIRLNSNHPVPIQTDKDWNIGRLKKEISICNSIPPEEIRIIFQGKELQDEVYMKEFDFGNQTILHAVRATHSTAQKRKVPRNQGPVGLNAISEMGHSDHPSPTKSGIPKTQFYVYCKSSCKCLQPGKLRVRCGTCHQGTLTVERDPCDWEDVLIPGRIGGECQAENCSGNVAEFVFKCKGHQSTDDTSIALELVKSNVLEVLCITCMEIGNPIIVFPCEDRHSMCLECFSVYCVTKLNDRGFVQNAEYGFTLGCPAGCDNSDIKEVHHFRILGEYQYDRYHRFATEECVLRSGGVLCPGRGCGTGLLPEGERRVVCEECRFVFCSECKEPYHNGDCSAALLDTTETGNAYQVDPLNAERARWDRESKETITKTTKPCPRCKVPTEKDGGCMHMACSHCSYQWCWQCSTEWNRDCQGDHWFG